MVFLNNFFETIAYLYTYLFVYNLSLIFLFWSFFNFVINHAKTIFFFSNLKLNFFVNTVVTSCLFSMAGVPPFLGFFSKLFILIILSSSNFFIFFIFFFTLLFLGLYFYIQNMRFLLTSTMSNTSSSFDFEIIFPTSYYLFAIYFLFFIFFGFLILDDLIFYFFWIFS